jgi:hypothetical protein
LCIGTYADANANSNTVSYCYAQSDTTPAPDAAPATNTAMMSGCDQ